MTDGKIRAILHFSGMVQGVGFRHTALQSSRNFDVVGTIENLSDGRVRLIVEGLPGEIDAFESQIIELMSGRVKRVDRQQASRTGEFSDFQIVAYAD